VKRARKKTATNHVDLEPLGESLESLLELEMAAVTLALEEPAQPAQPAQASQVPDEPEAVQENLPPVEPASASEVRGEPEATSETAAVASEVRGEPEAASEAAAEPSSVSEALTQPAVADGWQDAEPVSPDTPGPDANDEAQSQHDSASCPEFVDDRPMTPDCEIDDDEELIMFHSTVVVDLVQPSTGRNCQTIVLASGASSSADHVGNTTIVTLCGQTTEPHDVFGNVDAAAMWRGFMDSQFLAAPQDGQAVVDVVNHVRIHRVSFDNQLRSKPRPGCC
jgi:hypothetical protein